VVDPKAPDDVLDYMWNWGNWMPSGDSISTVNWTIPETYLAPPAHLIDSPSANGGSFAANAYYWVVTAVNDAGETTPSNEVTATLTGTTSSVGLGWNPVPGATGYNVYRGSNTSGTPVTVDGSATGTKIGNASGSTSSLTATCTYTRGSSANYIVAAVGFLAGLTPSVMTCSYGAQSMTLLGWNVTGYGGVAYFGLSSPATGSQTVSANVQSFGNVIGVVVAVSSFIGVGSTQYTGTAGGQESSPSQTVSAVYGDLVVWSAVNVTGSSINAAISGFNGTSLENSGNVSLPIADQIGLLLGYTSAPTSGTGTVSFSASVAQANIDQWWSAAALTLLPASPPINTLVTSISNPSTTQYTDTGSAGTTASPPAANTAFTSISLANSPASSHTTTTATAWIANGTAGNSYPVTCQITTQQGRVAQRTESIAVENL
jgi:hypothetical protein